ncbi:hypothetical protein LEMLEM_LOCUS25623, partial [Lemmus lemmus]
VKRQLADRIWILVPTSCDSSFVGPLPSSGRCRAGSQVLRIPAQKESEHLGPAVTGAGWGSVPHTPTACFLNPSPGC